MVESLESGQPPDTSRKQWTILIGPLLMAALALFLELIRDTPLRISTPPAIFNLAIVYVGFRGGLRPALASALIAWIYSAYFYSEPGFLNFTEDNFRRIFVWGVTMPLIACLVGVLNRRAVRALMQANLADVERAKAEEKARAAADLGRSEAYLEEAQRLAHAGSWAWNVATREFVHWSRDHYRLHGLDPGQEMPSWEAVLQQVHPEDRPRYRAQVDWAVGECRDWNLEYRCVLPDGTTRIIHSIAHPIFGAGEELIEFVGTEIDVTERKRAEEALRESEARFRTFVDHAADAFFLQDTEDYGRFLDVNHCACESLGYSREELIGHLPQDFDVGLTLEQITRIHERVGAGETFGFVTRHRRKDGSEFPVEVRVRPFRYGEKKYSVSLARDITERMQVEMALNESHDLLRAVVEGTPDAIFAKDLQGRYRLINSAGASVLGRAVEDVLGNENGVLLPLDAARAVRSRDIRVLATGETETFEETLATATGTRTYLSTKGPYRDRQGNVIGLVGIARDITEMKRLEAQFRQSQKMEALGRLAGGVAHDFNNLLTVITGYSELVFNTLRQDDPGRELLAEVQRAAERAVSLTRQLLAFSRKQVLLPQVTRLNPLLVNLYKMLQRLIGEDIELTHKLDPDLGRVRVDQGQFEQAILNMAVNSRDAISGTGRLTIETRNARLDEDYAKRRPDVSPGEYVVVEVSDTGHGMDEATKARIFEPFFTTKEAGKGTGLGLAMVYGFVRQSGGHIEVDSEPGRGTTFRLFLPCTKETGPSTRPDQEDFRVPKGEETILLAEDEDAVRALVRLVLQSYGYTVLEARDGQVGLEIAQQYQGTIHALVTDLVMPRMGGNELADHMTRIRPDVRVLFMSGHTDDAVLQREAEEGAAFIHKPFSPVALARKVRQLLDAAVAVH
jgi:two-component system, cell cycle sensor histidine kinase and response regulator CckA